MKAALTLEYIGETEEAYVSLMCRVMDHNLGPGTSKAVVGHARPRMPWVAEIVGRDPKFRYSRKFLKANWQRKRSNGNGSRGVELWFTLESGKVYEVKSPQTWKHTDHYFCTVSEDGDVIRISEYEVDEWVKNH